MLEIVGDFWELAPDYEALVCTTNGIVKTDGKLTMGAGIAKEFAIRFPLFPGFLGRQVTAYGNHVYQVKMNNWFLLSFPTKDDWKLPSKPQLIERSAREIVRILDCTDIKSVLLSRPGCGCGGMQWATVKGIIEPLLDNRFVVVDRKPL